MLPDAGIQLYTLRGPASQDLPGVLAALADLGYTKVEFAGYHGHAPQEVKRILADVGLAAPAAHATLGQMREDIDALIEHAVAVGHHYLVCAWMSPDQRTSLDAWRGICHEFNHFGEKCAAAGVQFAFHNHEFEFEELDGRMPYDLILERTDAGLVKLELDWYWTAYAGQDTIALMQAHPDRFRLFHVKDMATDRSMVDVGDGTLDFAALIEAARGVGGQHFFVERDNATEPLVTARRSIAHLRTL